MRINRKNQELIQKSETLDILMAVKPRYVNAYIDRRQIESWSASLCIIGTSKKESAALGPHIPEILKKVKQDSQKSGTDLQK